MLISLMKKIFNKKNQKKIIINNDVNLNEIQLKNNYDTRFLSSSIINEGSIAKNIEKLNSIIEEDKEFLRFIAISESKNQIINLNIGVIDSIETNNQGSISPIILDMLSGEKIHNVKKLMCFNLEAAKMLTNLNKGQFLALFKLAHFNIDEEMEVEKELSKPILTLDMLEKLKEIGFYSEKENSSNYISHYWKSIFSFEYETKVKEIKIEDELQDMIENKRLTLHLSNESTEPELGVVFSFENYNDQRNPVLSCFGLQSEKITVFFGLPHYYSKALVSCFENLTKQDINALYYGVRKEDLIDDRKNYTTYVEFKKNINIQLENYKNYTPEKIKI